MRPARLALLALGFAAATSQADLLLSDYATVALDSATTNKLYGIQSFSNSMSSTDALVPEAGYVRLNAKTFVTEGTEGYSANLGLLHPVHRDWSSLNIASATAISFDFRYDRKPGGSIEVSLSSKLYPKVMSDSGQVYLYKLPTSSLPAVNTWKTITIPIASFLPPNWFCVPGDLVKTCPADFPTKEGVLRQLEALQFAPKTGYKDPGVAKGVACTFCINPTTPSVVLDIRNVTLVGYEETVPNPTSLGCQDAPYQTLDTFEDGDNANELGGYWFAYSDTSADPAKALDSARGTSTVGMDIAAPATVGTMGYATLKAGLNKKTGEVFDWRPYAGWAAIGANFEGGKAQSFAGLTGISFEVKSLHMGPQVKGINFKASMPGISEATTHFAFLPAANVDPLSPKFMKRICVRPEDLMQPSWVKGRVSFNPDSILQFAWEAKIADQADPLIFADSAAFTLTNIQFHKDSARVGVGARSVSSRFGASYRNGVLSLTRAAGFDNILVVSSSGVVQKRIVSNASQFALPLDRGTYYVVARNSKGQSLSRSIAVVR